MIQMMRTGCEQMGCTMKMRSVAQHHPRAYNMHLPCLPSRSCCLRKTYKRARAHRVSQRMQPQALAFGGVAPADLQTELELLEQSQGGLQAEAKVHSELLTLSEAQQIAAKRGLYLYARTLGPFYRIVIRDKDESGKVMAVSSGFTVPAMGLMHCDSLEIFTRGLKGIEGERLRGGALGLGLLMGGAVFSFGHSCGCRKAEILAIKDDDAWHKRLVRYYSYFGFMPVREVGDSGLRDIPDLLVWGGVGQRMDANIEELLSRWTSAIRRSVPKGLN